MGNHKLESICKTRKGKLDICGCLGEIYVDLNVLFDNQTYKLFLAFNH